MLRNLIFFICLYLPFQFALNPVSGIDLASVRVFILFIFFLWLASGLKNGKLGIKNNWLTFFVCLFLFFSLFSALFGKNLSFSFRKILYIYSIFPIYFVASCVIEDKESALKIFKFLVFSGTGTAIIGISEFFLQFVIGLKNTYRIWAEIFAPVFLGDTFSISVLKYSSWLVNISGNTYLRAVSFFPDPHMFSFYLGLIVPVALGFFLKTRKKSYLAMFFIMLSAGLLAFSRGAYIGIISGLFIMIVLIWRKIDVKIRTILAIGTCIIFFMMIIPNPISERLFSSFDFSEGSNVGRLKMWNVAWEVFKGHPLSGVGIGNFILEVDPSAAYRDPIYAHNTYLDVASESGVLGLLSWIGIIVSSLYYFLVRSKDDIIFQAAGIGIIIFSIHSIFELAIYSPVVLAAFLIIISIGDVQKKLQSS